MPLLEPWGTDAPVTLGYYVGAEGLTQAPMLVQLALYCLSCLPYPSFSFLMWSFQLSSSQENIRSLRLNNSVPEISDTLARSGWYIPLSLLFYFPFLTLVGELFSPAHHFFFPDWISFNTHSYLLHFHFLSVLLLVFFLFTGIYLSFSHWNHMYFYFLSLLPTAEYY